MSGAAAEPSRYRLITGLLPKGLAGPALRALKSERGVIASNIVNARGVGRATPLAARGIAAQSEKEMLSVVVPAEEADEVLAYLYETAGIDQPHGGIVYMARLDRATEFLLPDLPEEA